MLDCQLIQDTFFNQTVQPHLDSVKNGSKTIMVMMGDDFDFDIPYTQKGPGHPAPKWDTSDKETTFPKLESVMRTLNDICPDDRYHVKMATPSEYLSHLSPKDLPTVKMDFSHYDERAIILHPSLKNRDKIDYWTGYFDNLPQLKQLIVHAFDTYHMGRVFVTGQGDFWEKAG